MDLEIWNRVDLLPAVRSFDVGPPPDIRVPTIPLPEIPLPEIPLPEIPVPRIPSPAVPAPKFAQPDLRIPDLALPKVPDVRIAPIDLGWSAASEVAVASAWAGVERAARQLDRGGRTRVVDALREWDGVATRWSTAFTAGDWDTVATPSVAWEAPREPVRNPWLDFFQSIAELFYDALDHLDERRDQFDRWRRETWTVFSALGVRGLVDLLLNVERERPRRVVWLARAGRRSLRSRLDRLCHSITRHGPPFAARHRPSLHQGWVRMPTSG